MLIYLVVLFLIIACVFSFDIKGRKKGRLKWERIIVVVLILLAGLRNHVGTDTINYENTFVYNTPVLSDFFKYLSWDELREPLWALLMSFCKTVFGSFVALQFIHAFILNVLLLRFFKKNTDKVFTAFLITFLVSWFGLNFEILRQSLCTAIFLNAVLLLNERKFGPYVFLSLLMFGFHNFSIIISVLAPLVLYTRKEIFYPGLIILFVLIVVFVDETIMNLFFLQAEEFATDNMQEKINAYTNYSNYGYIKFNINGLIKLIVLSILFPLSIILLNGGKSDSNIHNERMRCNSHELLNLFIVMYIVFGVFTSKLNILFRFQQYYLPFVIVAATNVIYARYKKALLNLSFWLLFSVFIVDSVYTLYRPSGEAENSPVPYDTRYFPYTSVFEEKDPLRERMWNIY